MIRISGLTKAFDDGDRRVIVLNGLSVSVSECASLAVTGPSGSGKSTLLNIMAGVLAADDGTVELVTKDGTFALHEATEAQRTRIRRRYVGYVHQFFNLIPTLTVLENVLLPAHLNKRPELEEDAVGLLRGFGLAGRSLSFPEVLSGGEQQRVAVARALLVRPALLLADEPTGNLDRRNADAVADLLYGMAAQYEVTLVVATHSGRVASRADATLSLESGGAL